jgi:hypothetical protein
MDYGLNELGKATYNYLNNKLNLDEIVNKELDNISDFGWEKASVDFDIDMCPERNRMPHGYYGRNRNAKE